MDYVSTPTGLILPERFAELEARRRHRPKAMEFFAGAGGMALGHIMAGHEVVAVSEWHAAAAITLMANLCRLGEHQLHFVEPSDQQRFEAELTRQWRPHGLKIKDGYLVGDGRTDLGTGEPVRAGVGWISKQPASTPGVSHIFFGDIRALTPQRVLDTIGMKIGELDMVSGGPPCQGFSKAGKQNVMDPRNSLVFEWLRFVTEMQPKAVLMEEVPEIATMVTPEGDNVLDRVIRILSDGGFGGYDALQKSVNAKAGSMGIIRGKTKPAKPKATPAKLPAPGMPDLFG
jgi:DNA (cytosine-5)-methyltransferase 1